MGRVLHQGRQRVMCILVAMLIHQYRCPTVRNVQPDIVPLPRLLAPILVRHGHCRLDAGKAEIMITLLRGLLLFQKRVALKIFTLRRQPNTENSQSFWLAEPRQATASAAARRALVATVSPWRLGRSEKDTHPIAGARNEVHVSAEGMAAGFSVLFDAGA